MPKYGLYLIAAVTVCVLLACHVTNAEDERDVAELPGPDRYPIDESDDVIPMEMEGGEEGGDWLEGDEEEDIEEGKRGRMFVGKRGRMFVGKRGRMFVGKRGRMFVGKRGRMFVGKRRIILRPVSHLNKRSPTDEAINQKFTENHVANVATVVKRSASVKVNSPELRPM